MFAKRLNTFAAGRAKAAAPTTILDSALFDLIIDPGGSPELYDGVSLTTLSQSGGTVGTYDSLPGITCNGSFSMTTCQDTDGFSAITLGWRIRPGYATPTNQQSVSNWSVVNPYPGVQIANAVATTAALVFRVGGTDADGMLTTGDLKSTLWDGYSPAGTSDYPHWIHACCSGTQSRIYVDGSLVATKNSFGATAPNLSRATNLVINWATSSYNPKTLFNLAVWDYDIGGDGVTEHISIV